MKAKKILLLLGLVYLLSGCTITYHLDISTSGYLETIDVGYTIDEDVQSYYIPVIFGTLELEDPTTNFFTKVNGLDYYDNELIGGNNSTTVRYSYNFSSSNFKNSYVANNAYHTFIVKSYDHDDDGYTDYMLLTTDDNFLLFNRLDEVDMIVVNITCDYEVISSNADEVNKNVYSWYITPDNIPTISFVFDPEQVVDHRSFWEKFLDGNSYTVFAVFFGIFLLAGLIYLVIKKRSDKVDAI